MPVSLTPRPQPGDLITAEWMDRLARASEELYARLDALSNRLAVLEKGGGAEGPPLVSVDANILQDFIREARVTKKILDINDKVMRLETLSEMWLEHRDELVIDDDVKRSKELTPEEWIMLGAIAGIKPTAVPDVLAATLPTTARAVATELGPGLIELDRFANLTTGTIGWR